MIQRFSSPEPESEALRELVWKLAGLRHAHLPRDKARWLELLSDSPFLQGPVGVYADEFAQDRKRSAVVWIVAIIVVLIAVLVFVLS